MAASLMELACCYVVENINSVDCLCGLPEVIGEYIFRHLLEYYFVNNNRVKLQHGLRVFADAFGPLLLKQLDLSNRLITINEYTECLLPLISNVVALNLSHCHLGMNHEIMQHFMATNMTHLRTLIMKDCGLNDEDLRKLTIPCRMYKKGIIHLKNFDLSNNPKLTATSLKFLICLKELQLLVLSGTSIQQSEAESFGCKTNFSFNIDDSILNSSFKIHAEGWAEKLLENWISSDEDKPQKKSLSAVRNSTLGFYKSSSVYREISQELRTPHALKKEPNVCLIRQVLPTIKPKLMNRQHAQQGAWKATASYEIGRSRLKSPIRKQTNKRKLIEILDVIDKENSHAFC